MAAAYVDFKRSMGAVYARGAQYLRRFGAYCAERGHGRVTRKACEGFVALVDAGRVGADHSWLCYLRGFAHWARLRGDPEAWAFPVGYSPRGARPEVYLLAAAEVEAFFAAAADLDCGKPWAWQAKAFFGMMCACGLRPGEARRLARGDVDARARTVLVRDSKGPVSRLLPLTDEVAAMLEACDAANNRVWPDRSAFFASSSGGPVGAGRVPELFNQIWRAAGLRVPSREPRPHAYSFRHRFACANIERWAQEGQDAAAMLPYLARYMGHASPESTVYYLHISPDYLRLRAAESPASASLLPKAGFGG
jgi:integrase